MVAQPPASNLSLSQKPDSVQGSEFTAQTRQVVKSAQASGSGQAIAEVQGIGSPQGPTYGVEYSVGGPLWGYLSDESIDSLEDATLEFHHEYSECPGGDRCEYTAKECIAHVCRLRKKAKPIWTPIVHTCSDAAASHSDGLCTVPRIHEQASSTMVAMDNHYKMSLYGCMFAALSCLLGKGEARPQMPKDSAWNPSIQPTHSPGALDESWRQVAHYLDEMHPSPSEPTALVRRPSPPKLHPPRDTARPAPENIPFLALRAMSSKPAPDEESECALSDEEISEDSDGAQRASVTGLQDWSSHRLVQVLSVPTFSGGESPLSDLEADSQISNGTNDPILQHAKKRQMRKTKGEKEAGKTPTSEHSGGTRLAYRSTLQGVTSGILTNITSANDPNVALGGRYDRRPLRMVLHVPNVLHIGPIPSGIKRKHIVWFRSYESEYCNGLTALPRTLKRKSLRRFCPLWMLLHPGQIDSLDAIGAKRTMRYDKIGVRRNASGLTLPSVFFLHCVSPRYPRGTGDPSVYILKWWRRSFYKGLGG